VLKHALSVAAAGVLTAGLAAAADAPVTPQKNWSAVRTRNFSVIGDSGERNLRAVATRLEQFREALAVVIPKAVAVTTEPVTVIVFRNHKAFEPFKPVHAGKVKKFISGYFQGGRSMNYIALTTEGSADFEIIYHEYVHFVVRSVIPDVPIWFNEGLAEYFSAFDGYPGARSARLGKPQVDHVYLLREQSPPWLPLETLVAVQYDSEQYNEANKASVFYAQSWALVHYLLLGENQKYFGKAAEFLQQMAQGATLEDACSKALQMTPALLERRLREYVQLPALPQINITFSEGIANLERLPVTPVPDSEAHATLGGLLLAMGRDQDARRQLEAALALDSESALAHAWMGQLLMQADRPDDARAHLERAVAADEASWLTHYMYASLLRSSAAAKDAATRASIERALRRTIELNAEFADAYAELAWLKSHDPATRQEALALAHSALTKMPGSERYAYLIASLLTMNGEYAPAKAILTKLSRSGNDEGVRTAASDLLGRIRRVEAEAATGARDDGRARPLGGGGGGAQTFLPLFRKLGAGEQRVKGTLTAIECAGGRIALVLLVDGRPAKLRVADFQQIEFITYREDLTGQINCGPRPTTDTVLVTYRPETSAGADALGDAVAVEFPPPDFE
jgi:tetratricopeptide (TPR) repeat protein